MKPSEDQFLPGVLAAVIAILLSIGIFVVATARNGTPIGIYDNGIGDHWPASERNLTIVDRTDNPGWHDAVVAAVATWADGGSDLHFTVTVADTPATCTQQRDRIEFCLATTAQLAEEGSDQDQGLFLPKVGRTHQFKSSILLVCSDCDIDQERMTVIATHELGHALGLAHNPDKQSVMYYQGGSTQPDAHDYQVLRQLEGDARAGG